MGTRIRSLLTAAAVVFGFATGAAAQPDPLRGVVHDHTGTPIAGVVVTVEHPQQTVVRVVLTDLKGQYTVGPLERGIRYTVRVSHPKFRNARLDAVAGDEVTVKLKPRRSSQREGQQAAAVARQ
jgi:Carboxypeptidase regulatory-like domain